MRLMLLLLFVSLFGCAKVSEDELRIKVDKCAAAGMDYTYLKDFRGNPYDVMCVARRPR